MFLDHKTEKQIRTEVSEKISYNWTMYCQLTQGHVLGHAKHLKCRSIEIIQSTSQTTTESNWKSTEIAEKF